MGGEALESGHEFGAGEERSRRRERAEGVPIVEAVAGLSGEETFEETRGGGVEGDVVFGGELGVFAGLVFELGEAERDGFFDLLRQVEVVAGDVREERVDEVQATEVVAGGGGHQSLAAGFLSRALISCMNSETSRNSLYTLAKRT